MTVMRTHLTNKMLNRIALDPGVPIPNPTKSIWQSPAHKLADIQSPALPKSTDILVIGSGISSCAFLYHFFNKGMQQKVTVLEARTLCSGATGRNGGHLRDSPFMYFGDLKRRFGLDSAKRMYKFRSGQIREIIEVIKKEGLGEAAELEEVQAVDIICEVEVWKSLLEELEEFRAEFGNDNCPKVWQAENAQKEFGVPHAVGAFTYPAATHSTYHLVCELFSKLLDRYCDRLNIETSTPAEGIEVISNDENYGYLVKTPRGSIKTKHIVHCTNGFAAHLIPGLRSKIFPVREQMNEQVFTLPSVATTVSRSWAFLWSKGFDYFIHRRASNSLLIGGALSQSGDDGLDEFGLSSDRGRGLFIGSYLRGFLPTIFSKDGKSGEVEFKNAWTGIMGWSADLLPWVGKLPEEVMQRNKPGAGGCAEWIVGGYSGEGMTHAWGCARALASIFLGHEKVDDLYSWFPKEYIVSLERTKKADVRKLKDLY